MKKLTFKTRYVLTVKDTTGHLWTFYPVTSEYTPEQFKRQNLEHLICAVKSTDELPAYTLARVSELYRNLMSRSDDWWKIEITNLDWGVARKPFRLSKNTLAVHGIWADVEKLDKTDLGVVTKPRRSASWKPTAQRVPDSTLSAQLDAGAKEHVTVRPNGEIRVSYKGKDKETK